MIPHEHLPKAVLHDHLDGGLRPATVIELADEIGYTGLPSTDLEELSRWFDQGQSGSLERYLAAFAHTIGVMQTPEAIERVAYESVVDLAADGVVYAELRFAPSLNIERGMSRHEVLEAALEGMRRGSEDTGTATGLIVVAMRNGDDSDAVIEAAIDFADEGVIGFDLAGPELGFPPEAHVDACRRAGEHLAGLTLHAGEADGPDSIRKSLDLCGADRIGHGVHVIDDCRVVDGDIVDVGRLAQRLLDDQIPLEICVSSNLHTHDWSPAEHPVGMLYRAGFAITINTDNRLMSSTSMSKEFAILAKHHGFTAGDFDAVTRRALAAAFGSAPDLGQL